MAKLDDVGNLVLVDGNTTVWISNTSSLGVQYGVMSGSGSFILYNGSSSNRQVAWQSFWHPSDTLLPGQPLLVSLELTSPKSSLGLYSLKMLQQRSSLSLALTYISPEPYFSSLGSHANYSYWSSPEISNATGEVIAELDEAGSFGIRYGTSSTGTMYVHKNDSAGNQSILRRIAIGTDGNLRLYRWDNQWVVEWSAVSNPCLVAGICGSGVCNLDGSKSNASCTCLPGTSPVGSGINGCLSSSIPSPQRNCSGTRNTSIRMETMPQTNYYFSGASTISNYTSVSRSSECAELCLSDCNCVASVHGLSEGETCCWTLRSMVFGGLQDPSSTLYIKLGMNSSGTREQGPPEGSGGPTSDSPKGSQRLLLPLLLCISSLVVLLSLLLCYSIRRRRMQRQQGLISGSLSLPGCPLHFSFHDLQSATCNFSRLLGTGNGLSFTCYH